MPIVPRRSRRHDRRRARGRSQHGVLCHLSSGKEGVERLFNVSLLTEHTETEETEEREETEMAEGTDFTQRRRDTENDMYGQTSCSASLCLRVGSVPSVISVSVISVSFTSVSFTSVSFTSVSS